MRSESSSASRTGIGFPALLGLTFIILKLCKVIDWSWWWVLSPFWIGIALIFIIGILYIIVKFFTD